jgi:DnaJ-class molecular chaperone
MQTDSRVVHKTPISVEITLTDGSVFRGMIFTTPKGRLIDVLNDERDFIPVGNAEGAVMAIAKTAIKQIALPAMEAPVYRGSDPYQILGVAENVSEAKLREAYHQLSLKNHPDRIRGFGLGSDFLELASQNMVRINNAYAHILRLIRKADGDTFGAEHEAVKKKHAARVA